MHPRVKVVGVETVKSCHFVAWMLHGKFTCHFPDLSKSMQLVGGDALDPNLDPETQLYRLRLC